MTLDNREITLVDKEDRILGYKNVIAGHTNPALLHRAISVLIFNKNRILLQKRSKYKFNWPLFWANTVCSNVYRGESYREAAKRALKNEMGIEAKFRKVFKFTYAAKYNGQFGENEIDTVYRGEYSGKVKPNPKETADYKWVEIRELKRDINKNPEKYTPWLKLILKKLKF